MAFTGGFGEFAVQGNNRLLRKARPYPGFQLWGEVDFRHQQQGLLAECEGAFDQTQIPKDAIDRKLMARHLVLPLARRGNRLAVAISNPTNKPALDQIKFQTSLAIDPVVVEDDKLAKLMADMVD